MKIELKLLTKIDTVSTWIFEIIFFVCLILITIYSHFIFWIFFFLILVLVNILHLIVLKQKKPQLKE